MDGINRIMIRPRFLRDSDVLSDALLVHGCLVENTRFARSVKRLLRLSDHGITRHSTLDNINGQWQNKAIRTTLLR